jgi:hypothetical protein
MREIPRIGFWIIGRAWMGFLGTCARHFMGEEAIDGEESSGVEGLLRGDPTLAPALGAFPANEGPVFWVMGMEETLDNKAFFPILCVHAWNGLVI